MLTLRRFSWAACGLVLALAAGGGAARGMEIFAAPGADEVRTRALEWAAARNVEDQAALDQIWAAGEDLSAREVFDRVIATFRLADAETRDFVDACTLLEAPLVPPQPAILSGREADEFYTANLRLFYARYLAQRRMYDEALEVFAQIEPAQVVDPASCLFYQAVCQHQLLMKDEGLATIKRLLENTEQVPVSYSSVASLMQYELEGLREKTLDEVARQMRDVERRLDLGRAGERVQKKEGEIIATLDEIIKKLEQQGGG